MTYQERIDLAISKVIMYQADSNCIRVLHRTERGFNVITFSYSWCNMELLRDARKVNIDVNLYTFKQYLNNLLTPVLLLAA